MGVILRGVESIGHFDTCITYWEIMFMTIKSFEMIETDLETALMLQL